jgi:hypothetical protein
MVNEFCPFVTSRFSADEQGREEFAFKQVSKIPEITFISEYLVTRTLLLHLTLVAQHVILLPIWTHVAFFKSQFNSRESRHTLGIYLSFAITLGLTFVLPVSYDAAFDLMKTQSIYKLWAVYALVKIVVRHAIKMHKFGHRVLRGAVRTDSFPLFLVGVGVHTAITTLYFYLFALYNACYLAGLCGKSKLFFSACVHIQAAILKKWLPKVTESPPAVEEPCQRMVLWVAVLYHLTSGAFSEIVMMIGFEYVATFGRYFLCSFTEDASKWYEALRKGADAQVLQFQRNDSRLDASLIVQIPTEMFAVGVASLIFKGPLFNSVLIGVSLLGLAMVGGPAVVAIAGLGTEVGHKKAKTD